jgi:transcriptional regulator with XRE-family HTH domain
MIRKAIGQALREVRESRHLTQAQLGESLDTDRQTVGRWERGKHMPDDEVYSKLPGVLGVSTHTFLDAVDRAQRRILREREEEEQATGKKQRRDKRYAPPITPDNEIVEADEWIRGIILIPRSALR